MFSIKRKSYSSNFRYYRSIMNGYSILKKSERLSLLDEIRNEVTVRPLLKKGKIVSLLNEERRMDAVDDLIIKQYLIQRLLSLDFNKAILFTLSTGRPLCYPLPRQWQRIVKNHGIKVNFFCCSLFFYSKVLLLGLHGIAEMILLFFHSLRPSMLRYYKGLGIYSYFDNLQPSNLPSCTGNYKYGIVSSYILKFPKPDNLYTICHSVSKIPKLLVINGVNVKYVPSAVPPVTDFYKLGKTFFYSIFYISISIISFLSLRWENLLILREKIRAEFFKNSEKDYKAHQFFFHNSNWIFRPLWTYHAVKEGCYVGLYFYSTNCERFKQKGKYPPIAFSWPITTWPNYLVWDQYQADFIKRARGRENLTNIVGNISFQFNDQQFDPPKQAYIAVFDVQPMRDTFHNVIGMDMAYYIPEVACKFIDDVINSANEKGIMVVVKQKRSIGKNLHSDYRKMFKKHLDNPLCLLVDPLIEAEKIIEKSFGVVSMPFTSTAILGAMMNKPSVYYDSISELEYDDRAAHGISIICNKDALRRWIDLIIENDRFYEKNNFGA